MKSALWWLGLIFGTLSVVMLIKDGFEHGFAQPLEVLLEHYSASVRVLLSPIEYVTLEGLRAISRWLGIDLKLDHVWRHLFVLLSLVVGANARHDVFSRRYARAALRSLVGGVLALVVSVSSGVGFAKYPDGRGPEGLLFAISLAPIAFVMLVDAFGRLSEGMTIPAVFGRAVAIGAAGVVSFFAMVSFVVVSKIWDPEPRGFLVAFFLLVPLVAYSIFSAAAGGGGRSIGLQLLATMSAVAIFMLTNAGLKLAGL